MEFVEPEAGTSKLVTIEGADHIEPLSVDKLLFRKVVCLVSDKNCDHLDFFMKLLYKKAFYDKHGRDVMFQERLDDDFTLIPSPFVEKKESAFEFPVPGESSKRSRTESEKDDAQAEDAIQRVHKRFKSSKKPKSVEFLPTTDDDDSSSD